MQRAEMGLKCMLYVNLLEIDVTYAIGNYSDIVVIVTYLAYTETERILRQQVL